MWRSATTEANFNLILQGAGRDEVHHVRPAIVATRTVDACTSSVNVEAKGAQDSAEKAVVFLCSSRTSTFSTACYGAGN